MKEKRKWRRLDNSAKLFPIVSTKKFSSVYRLSVVLNEEINKEVLKKAVNKTLTYFTTFKVCLKKGFFWYYLDENKKEVIIEKERTYPCQYFDRKRNNGYLFRVTYYKNKINVEIFHSLTDGTSGMEFLKAIVYQYLNYQHSDKLKDDFSIKKIDSDTENIEDSYLKNYEKHLPNNSSGKRAYIIKGNLLPFFQAGVTHGFISLKPVIKTCRRLKVTVTQYFTAVLMYSIFQEEKRIKQEQKNKKSSKNKQSENHKLSERDKQTEKLKLTKKPMKVCIPVNLKRYFDSTTITNFFSYITLEASFQKVNMENFEDILKFVKSDFKARLNKEELAKTMSQTVKMGNSIYIRMIPLFVKKIILKAIYGEIQKYTTTTFSNLGKINVLPEYEPYIQNFFFSIGPELAEKIKCTSCSYGNNIVFSITSILKQPNIERNFFKFLTEHNIPNQIVTNDIYKEHREHLLYPKIKNSILPKRKNKSSNTKMQQSSQKTSESLNKKESKFKLIEELKKIFHM